MQKRMVVLLLFLSACSASAVCTEADGVQATSVKVREDFSGMAAAFFDNLGKCYTQIIRGEQVQMSAPAKTQQAGCF